MPLARLGITHGRKVDAAGLVPGEAFTHLDDCSQSVLSRLGFMRIARKIVEERPLSFEDGELLVSKASLPVLMKLVSLKRRPLDRQEIVPAIVFPFKMWLKLESDLDKAAALASDILRGMDYDTIHIAFDGFSLSTVTPAVEELILTVSKCRRGIVVTGPSLDEIKYWINGNYKPASPEEMEFFARKILNKLKRMGFKRLRCSYSDDLFSAAHKAGFENSLYTDVEAFDTANSMVSELFRINDLAEEEGLVDVWLPSALCTSRAETGVSRAGLDYKILKAISHGTLLLENVPYVRASSRFLSLNAVSIASYFGANDLGYGAVDRTTVRSLRLKPMSELKAVMAIAM